MSSDLAYGDRYAENLQEEAQAEAREEREAEERRCGGDIDDAYDRIRDDNTEVLMENVKELLEQTKKLWYYNNRKEGLARDIIQFVLSELKLKIVSVDNLTPTYQNINLEVSV